MSCDAILVLVCGLPAAGKTTLVKHLVNTGNTASRLYERISFDDVYEEMVGNDGDGKASEFNPGKWKESQQAMVARVTERLEDQSASASDNGTTQQLVLLVDDNFQYRSQRKRFFHLAAHLKCGFAVLYVNVSTEICRERNNARGLGGRAGVHVPGEVFERMTTAFEAPDGDQNPWEVSTCELDRADDSVDFVGLMDELIKQAEGELKSRGGLQLERQNEEAQQRLDRLATQQNALHLVDLELRQWISAKLRDETALPAGMTKKELASILNKRRKSFLALMKGFSTDITQGKSIEEVVVSLVARFHQQE